MHIGVEPLKLQLESPFKISYGATTHRENILIHIDDGTHTGIGEAAVVPYYGESTGRVLDYFNHPELQSALNNHAGWLEDTLNHLPDNESSSARAAVDIALHDLWGKQLGQPLYRLWGLNPARSPVTSFTVAMADDPADYRARLRAAAKYPLIKLKLGSGSIDADLTYVQTAREQLPNAGLCVDANGGWSAADALSLIPRLAEFDVLFVEQPVAKADMAGWETLRQKLPANLPPLIADESVQGVESVPALVGLVDGINIKLAKCGGLRPARQMIALARAYGMKVMIGCMVESSVALTAAAHLAPLVDYADLDSILLITNDPYRGVTIDNGRLTLPDTPGLGVIPK